MDAVDAALLDAVRADLFSKAWGIAGQRLRQLGLVEDGVDEFADHRVLAGADQVQVLALDLVHHVLHLGKAHDAVDDAGADHERRDVIGESPVDHKISGVGQDGRLQSGDVAAQVVEAGAAGLSGAVQIDAV